VSPAHWDSWPYTICAFIMSPEHTPHRVLPTAPTLNLPLSVNGCYTDIARLGSQQKAQWAQIHEAFKSKEKPVNASHLTGVCTGVCVSSLLGLLASHHLCLMSPEHTLYRVLPTAPTPPVPLHCTGLCVSCLLGLPHFCQLRLNIVKTQPHPGPCPNFSPANSSFAPHRSLCPQPTGTPPLGLSSLA
jgi:hypothetical protein